MLNSFFKHPFAPVGLIVFLAAFFSLLLLGAHPLMHWDESLHGEIALQMLQNGDYFNYYFGGQQESWFAKPPLAIWAIVLSYKSFGINAFALRLPSALAIVISIFFLYKSIRIYKDERFAFFSCLLLITTESLIGSHVGRSGDTDALLVCFLMMASYFFLKCVDGQRPVSAIYVGLFLGLAFWVKGPAALTLLPAWLLYLILGKKLKSYLRSPWAWTGIFLFILILASWIGLSLRLGNEFPDKPFLGKNSLETLILYDIVERFTQGSGAPNTFGYFYFFHVLDVKFSIWNYVGYALLLFSWIKGDFKHIFQRNEKGSLHLYACLCWLILALFLTFASSKHIWYMAPVLPFLAINIWGLVDFYTKKYRYFSYLILLLFLISAGLKLYKTASPKSDAPLLVQHEALFKEAEKVVFMSKFPLDRFLYIHFRNPNCVLEDSFPDLNNAPGYLFVINPDNYWANQEKFAGLIEIASDEKSIFLQLPYSK